jgi:hypothetical protein
MARSRNIKNTFFENDRLAEISPLGRLFFIGLWTISDFKGDLEYRPKRLKAQILPYDDCDIDKIVKDLYKSRFITIYNVGGVEYIHIKGFVKHQNPHPNEKKKGSEVPEFKDEFTQPIDSKGVAINHDSIVTNPADSLSLIPDSLSPIPDSGTLIPDKTLVTLKHDSGLDVFRYWQEVMNHPRSAYDSKRKAAINKYLKLYSVDDLKKAVHGCSVTPHNMGDNDRGERYDSLITVIFKSADQIDRFMKNSDRPPSGNIKTIEQTNNEALAQVERVKQHLGFNDD